MMNCILASEVASGSFLEPRTKEGVFWCSTSRYVTRHCCSTSYHGPLLCSLFWHVFLVFLDIFLVLERQFLKLILFLRIRSSAPYKKDIIILEVGYITTSRYFIFKFLTSGSVYQSSNNYRDNKFY